MRKRSDPIQHLSRGFADGKGTQDALFAGAKATEKQFRQETIKAAASEQVEEVPGVVTP